jgi:hypothetical protein
MKEIDRIDKEFTKSAKALQIETEKLTFSRICEFKVNKNSSSNIPWETLKYPGIYLIEIKNDGNFNSFESWVEDFREKWEDERYLKSHTPNLIKTRIEKHTDLGEWIPIYLGKAETIGSRIREHIFKELCKTTYALKLNARENLENEIFRLKTIKCQVANYKLIVPSIESQLRNKINPLIGKQ